MNMFVFDSEILRAIAVTSAEVGFLTLPSSLLRFSHTSGERWNYTEHRK